MNDLPPEFKIIQELTRLHELSLAIGTTLELRENCSIFLRKLIALQNLAYAAVWIKVAVLPEEMGDGAQLICAMPGAPPREDRIPLSHPLLALRDEKPFLSVSAADSAFADTHNVVGLNEGMFLLFPLGQIGVLQLLFATQTSVPEQAELVQLAKVIDKFAHSLFSCLAYQTTLKEIRTRRQAEAKLQQLRNRLEQLLHERTAELKKSDNALIQFRLAHDKRLAQLGHDLRSPLSLILFMAESLQGGIFGHLTAEQQRSVKKIEESGYRLLSVMHDELTATQANESPAGRGQSPSTVGDEVGKRSALSPPARQQPADFELAKKDVDAPAEYIAQKKILKSIGFTILLAEDNQENAQTATDFLESRGFNIILAVNGREAVALARKEQPALILMDIQMPEMDGLEATRQIRADNAVKEIPIIALTALAMPGDRERCLAAGVNEYMSKPVSLLQLARTIEQLLPGEMPQGNIITPARANPIPPSGASASMEKSAADTPLILLVDDDEMNLSVYLDVVEYKGYRSRTAFTGAEAIAQTQIEIPDLIIMDLHMPDLNGLETTRRLRADQRTENIPIILATGMAGKNDEERCLAAGATAYLTKPIKLQILINTIDKLLKK